VEHKHHVLARQLHGCRIPEPVDGADRGGGPSDTRRARRWDPGRQRRCVVHVHPWPVQLPATAASNYVQWLDELGREGDELPPQSHVVSSRAVAILIDTSLCDTRACVTRERVADT
jgi:hypothetical protein